MKKNLVIFWALLLFRFGLIAQIIQMPSPNSTSVMNGEYNVANNVWGATTAQTLEVDLNSTYYKVILSKHNNTGGSVAAYPFIWKGSHWGGTPTTNSPMPKMLTQIGTAPFTWSIDTTGVSGTWDAAFECWLDDVPISSTYVGELMIWLNYGGGAGPAGGKVATVNIGGYTWDVYFYLMSSWNYITYKIATPVDSISLDLKDFLRDALNRGYLKTSWYLANMEAGFEIWRDGQGLTCKSYSANITSGNSLDVNYPPAPFELVYPYDKKVLKLWAIPFSWNESFDPNSDELEYIFHLYGPNIDTTKAQFDTTITQLDTTSFLFDGSKCLRNNTFYYWDVKVTDGIDTSSSITVKSFRTPSTTGVEDIKQNPMHFSLSQNYPNPFNPQTMISYSLPQISNVTLKVYDLMGREVATLLSNEKKAAGNYEISFHGAYLSSGIYFYKLQTEYFIKTMKMALIK